MLVLPAKPSSLKPAILALASGELVVYPTETCYGLAADATNQAAVTKLFAYKGDRHRQISVAVSSKKMAEKYVHLNSMANNFYQEFLPGPLTVISSSLHHLDSRLESAEGTLGIRFPRHPFALSLITTFGHPITATSANTSGKKEPYSLSDWHKYTTKSKQAMVSLFLDAGKLIERPTSTVIDTTLNSPEILRQGSLVLPASAPVFTSPSPADTRAFAAGLISKYLPLTRRFPLVIALQGELGAGKTQFAKGIARALGIPDNITSPTYTLLKEYLYNLPKYSGTLYHLDTWRLSDMTELNATLHLNRLLKPGNLLVMEWAGKAKSWLQKYENEYPILLIDIKETTEHIRSISYSFSTPEWS